MSLGAQWLSQDFVVGSTLLREVQGWELGTGNNLHGGPGWSNLQIRIAQPCQRLRMYHQSSVRGNVCCWRGRCVTRGRTRRTCPVCLCKAGWGGLSPAINILLVDLRWFGERSFVAVSHSWELVSLWKRLLAKRARVSLLSWDCELMGARGTALLQRCNRLKMENYFLCYLWKLSFSL